MREGGREGDFIDKFLSFSLEMQIICHAQFYTFVKMNQRVSGIFGDLDPTSVGLTFSRQSMPAF